MTAPTDRRAQLAEAAFEVFTSRGYRNSAVADIVAAAGVSHGSFYNYFTNKREILDAAIDYGLESLGPQLTPPTEPAADLDEFLDAMTAPFRALHEFAMTNDRLVSLIVFDAAAIDDALTNRVIEVVESVAVDWQHQIEHGVQAGFLRPGLDAQVLGEVMVAMTLVVLLPAQGGAPLPGGLDHVISQIAEFLRAGLAAPAPHA
ncbi:TetR/AcrR family transcriptional regulator [[Mycobacterium] nativiensis]|uniref:TetR/AcrR family transcriptional regulator n=1 Tax=[Mycobacterium] nativiensis TaxID=2855503 RepID=A0ABU5XVH8_9MYCO|nr:TetR/AcrR family transcriptional regulator [Mycolicibacter sp. MYC340]MEB3031980.1 TetR/AcrR family transcriptional regulator [Mycolicibacter sp. MYC340]